MCSLVWKQQDSRNYSLENLNGNILATLENHTCLEKNITEAFLEECLQDFLENEKRKEELYENGTQSSECRT